MPKYSITVCGFFLSMLVGCAPKGTGPLFSLNPAPDEMATVYHYRLERGAGSGAAYTLLSNGKVVSVIGNGGYYVQHLKPGEYKYERILQLHQGPLPHALIGDAIDNARAKAEHAYTITVEPDKSYFLRWAVSGKVEPIQEEVALKELRSLRAFEPVR